MPVHEKKFLPLLAVSKYGQPTEENPISSRLEALKYCMLDTYRGLYIGDSQENQDNGLASISAWFEEGVIPEKCRLGGFALDLLGCYILKNPYTSAIDKAAYEQSSRYIKQALRDAKNTDQAIFEKIYLKALAPHDGSDTHTVLKSFESEHRIFGSQKRAVYKTINDWLAHGSFDFPTHRNNSSIIPFLRHYLHSQAVKTDSHSRLIFWLTWRDFKENLIRNTVPKTAANTGKGVTFDSHLDVKIMLPKEEATAVLEQLSSSLQGLYVMYKMRFGVPSVEDPEIAQELVLFHSLKSRKGTTDRAPLFTNWYFRRDGALAEFHGTCFSGRVVHHIVSMDQNFDNRMRFLNINQEYDKPTGGNYQSDVHKRVRGGIMLSESQETDSEWAAASKIVLVKFSSSTFKKNDAISDKITDLRKLARKTCQFIAAEDIPHPSAQLILKLIRNVPNERQEIDSGQKYPYLGHSIVMDQLDINRLARETPKNWGPF